MEISKVKIIKCTQNMDDICTASAMISTTKGSALEIYEDKKTLKKNKNLPLKVSEMGHVSLLEHAFFTLAFENVSVFVEQFMIEHRLASYTVKSRRYVDYSNQGFYNPDFKDSQLSLEYHVEMKRLFIAYEDLISLGIPKEDARFILPYSFRSNFYCTLNARELMKIIYSCLYGRGSKYQELKNIGESLYIQAKEKGLKSVFENLQDIFQFEDSLSKKAWDLVERENIGRFKGNKLEVFIISNTQNMMENAVQNEIIGQTGNNLIGKLSFHQKLCFFEEMLKDGRSRGLETVLSSFMIHNISLAGLTHITRHRMQTLIVPELIKGVNEENYVYPESIVKNLKAFNVYLKTIQNYLLWKNKKEINESEAPYFLLAGMKISIFTTMNLREMVHFFKLRTCYRSQWEIRDISKKMISLGKKYCDVDVFSRLGAGCFMTGKCPEGKFCCGKQKELIQELKSL